MSCVICHVELVDQIIMLVPCGHIAHRSCIEHTMKKMPEVGQGGRDRCKRCNAEVTSTRKVFFDDGDGDEDLVIPANRPAKAHAELYSAAYSYGKHKKNVTDLTNKCAQLHSRKEALLSKVSPSFKKEEFKKEERITVKVEGGGCALDSTLNGLDPVGKQVYVITTRKEQQQLQQQVAFKKSNIQQLDAEYKKLKEKLKSQKRARKSKADRSISPADCVRSHESGNECVRPDKRKPADVLALCSQARGDAPERDECDSEMYADDSDIVVVKSETRAHPGGTVSSGNKFKFPQAPLSSPSKRTRGGGPKYFDVDVVEVVDVECLSDLDELNDNDNSCCEIIGADAFGAKVRGKRALSETSSHVSIEQLPFDDPAALLMTQETLQQVLPHATKAKQIPTVGVTVGRSLRDVPTVIKNQADLFMMMNKAK